MRGLAGLFLLAACDTQSANGAPCAPGDYNYCACDDGIQGYSECPIDGGDYGPCDCTGIHPAVPSEGGVVCTRDDAGQLPLLCHCTTSADCASGNCYLFAAKGLFCTTTCTQQTASQVCPPQSGGCNGMGICKLP